MTEQAEPALYDLFISYASADSAWAEGYLLDALEEAGVHVHSEEAFALGVPRLVEFERAIRQSRRTLLILSPAYMTDRFGQFTDLLAQTYGLETATWPVIPLIWQSVELPSRLTQLVALDATDPARWEKAIAHLCAELQRPVPGPPPKPLCPYPGMVPFSEADSERFFGRDHEVQELIQRLRLHPFLTIIGASGSGKSSLVFAGLVPALRKSKLFGSGEWLVRSLRPGEMPMNALAAALGGDPAQPAQAVADLLAAHPGHRRLLLIVDQLEEMFTQCESCADDFQQALLELSQVKHCYVLLTVRADFYPDLMNSLLWAEIQAHRLEILPMDEEGLRQSIVRPAEDVGVFVESALAERLIADAAGEPGVLPLVQETLVLLWEHVERRFLPLHSYEALVLPRSAYTPTTPSEAALPARTGLQVAIARRADAALADLLPEQQAIARRIFIRLIQFGEGRSDTRRQQPLSRLRVVSQNRLAFDQTLDHLVNNRLLTLSGAEDGADRQVDIAHEALIRGWPTLQKWLGERRGAEQTRRLLESKAAEWLRLEKKGSILEEIELLEAEQWLNSPDAAELGYDQILFDLVEASRAVLKAAEREREEARQREMEAARRLAEEAAARERIQAEAARRLRARAWILAGIGTIALILAVISYVFYTQAQKEWAFAESYALAADAINYLDSDASFSLQLALTALDVMQTTQAQNTLRQVLLSAYPWRNLIDPALQSGSSHEAAARLVVWSHDGQHLASASYDGTIKIWSPEGQLETTLVGHRDRVRGMDWSHDDARIVSASFDGTVRLWDVTDLSPRWIGHTAVLQTWQEDHPNTVEWSPDERLLLISGSDGRVCLVDARTGQTLASVSEAPGNEVNKATWSPDGARFAYASDDATIKVWTLQDVLARPAAEITSTVILTGHGGYVLDVDWSPDGRRLASASYDGIRLWNALGGPSTDLLVGHKAGEVRSVDWSPDGTLLLSASVDKTLRVWDVGSGASVARLTGHKDWVFDARWHPDGRRIASASQDKMVRIWELTRPSVDVLAGHRGEVRRVAWSADGRWLASGADDGTLRIWDVPSRFSLAAVHDLGSTVIGLDWPVAGEPLTLISRQGIMGWARGQEIITLTVHQPSDYVYTLAWNADGTRLATVSQDGSIKLWRRSALKEAEPGSDVSALADGQLPPPEKDWFTSAAWSADGRQIATGSWKGTVQVWDAQTLENTHTFTGHTAIVWAMVWHPQGGRLASASQDKEVLIWDVDHPEDAPHRLAEHTGAVNDIQLSPTGQTFATASDDGTVKLWSWEARDGESLATLSGSERGIWSVAWSPDGKRIAAAVMDGTIWVFYTDLADVLAIAQEQKVAPMTRQEMERYFGEE